MSTPEFQTYEFQIENGTLMAVTPKTLEKAVIPDGVHTIGRFALFECEHLTELVLPEGLKTIELRAFDGCRSLCEVTLPESLETVEAYAFWGCESLKTVRFGKNIQWVASNAFLSCPKVSFDFADGISESLKREIAFMSPYTVYTVCEKTTPHARSYPVKGDTSSVFLVKTVLSYEDYAAYADEISLYRYNGFPIHPSQVILKDGLFYAVLYTEHINTADKMTNEEKSERPSYEYDIEYAVEKDCGWENHITKVEPTA